MQASAGIPIEAASLARPELKPALQLLPQADFQKFSRMANDALYLSQPLRQDLTEPEITKRLTSIPDLNANTRSELATTIGLHVETIDQTQRNQSEYLDSRKQKEGTPWAEEHVYPGIIDNLELVTAVTHENPQQENLHDQAVEARKRLVPTTEIIVKYADGNDKTHTLAEWDDVLDQEALKLWRKISPAATLNEFRSNDKMDPMTRFGFRLQAKQALLGTKPEEINKGIKVKFSYLGETAQSKPEEPPPPDEAPDPNEPPWLKELNVEQKAMYHMATTVEREALDALQQQELKDIVDDPALTSLGIFIDALGQAKSAESRRFLLAGIYSYLKKPTITQHLNQATTARLQSFLKDGKVTEEYNKIQGELLNKAIVPSLKAAFPQEWTNIVHGLSNDDINNLFEYIGIGASLHGLSADNVDLNLHKFREQGRAFSTSATDLIKAIAVKSEGRAIFEDTLTAMGLDVKALNDLKGYVRTHSDRIIESIEGTRERSENWDQEVKPKRKQVLEMISDIDKEKLEKKYKISPNFLMSLGGAAMIITMFQNTLGFGVFAEEEQRSGHQG